MLFLPDLSHQPRPSHGLMAIKACKNCCESNKMSHDLMTNYDVCPTSSAAGVCWRGGGGSNRLAKWRGSNRLPGLVTKQQAVEFPQVLTSYIILVYTCGNSTACLATKPESLLLPLLYLASLLSSPFPPPPLPTHP